jgi:predicted transcriptional regulator YheO
MPRPLDAYVPICDAIAGLLRPHAEVVLHDLTTQRIFYIANSYSKRRVGDSSLNEPESAFNEGADVIGPYPKTNWDGRRLKSITAVIRGRAQKLVGLLCINLEIDALASALDQLQHLIELPTRRGPTGPLVSKDWREGVNTVVGAFLAARRATLAGLTNDDMDSLVGKLDEHGIFEIRKAVPYVAEVLGLSRATIYNRLAAVRERRGQRHLKDRKN